MDCFYIKKLFYFKKGGVYGISISLDSWCANRIININLFAFPSLKKGRTFLQQIKENKMINQSPITTQPNNCHCEHFKCISWGAVFTGALVGLGLSFLLNVFALAIDLAVYHTSEHGGMAFAIGGFVGMAIGIIASMFFAGWVSGYLARFTSHNRHLGALYGLVTWCLTLVIAVLLVNHFRPFVASQYHSLTASNATNITMAYDSADSATTAPAADFNVGNTPTTAANKENAGKLGAAFFAMFVLFFLGAAASCFGGYCGLNPKRYAYKDNFSSPANM